ncbi:hypothetical protein DV515_00015648 [Chloebia gouldiae]|uniref:SH2 domain-containing protein n=1 Tax=Chloebia gouldiae TaxID=44316 RepID=A0A3L8RUU5_CHLGU|nr:hypothetical protein DV515_00015648 [Chloebia gouldiae]
MRLKGSVSLPAGRQRNCCRISPWAASWSASARAPWASSSPTGEGPSPVRGSGRGAQCPPGRCARAVPCHPIFCRGRDRCRHFVLDQLPDGRYVILGERSAHTELAELLQHHATAPVTPYREFLTVPLPCGRVSPGSREPPRAPFRLHGRRGLPKLGDTAKRSPSITLEATVASRSKEPAPGWKEEPRGRTQPPAGSDAARSPPSQAPAKLPEYRSVSLESARVEGSSAREVTGQRGWRHFPRTGATLLWRRGDAVTPTPSPHLRPAPSLPQAPDAPPPSLPAKTSSRGAARGLHSPSGSAAAAPEAPYAQVHKESSRPEPAEAKYQQLMCFHVYAEPREEIAPSPPSRCKPQEPIPEGPSPEGPIPFYAMARGWSPRAGPEENIYSEVALARQDVPAWLPRAPQNAFSTLPHKARPHRRLFRSASSQDCKRRQLAAAPSRERKDTGASSTGTQVAVSPELDDPVYRSTPRDPATAENVYEQLPGDCP